MDVYIDQITNYSVQIATIGIVSAIYIMLFSISRDNNNEVEADRVIKTLSSVVKGEIASITKVTIDNPYDLFTCIYPTLKDMDNDRISELVGLIENYNSNWISEDSD